MTPSRIALCLALPALLGAAPLPGVGADDARSVVDADRPPWSAVARLQIAGVSRCTAVLVAPRIALTAAHCLWERRLGHFAPPGSVHVLRGYSAGRFAAHTLAAGYRIPPGYDPTAKGGTAADDFAVVTLTAPLGNDVLALAVPAPLPGTPAMLGGYNQDRAEILAADSTCHIVGHAPGLLLHDCNGTHGTSGGPLLVRGPDGRWQLAGLQVAAFIGRSGGVAVAARVLQDALTSLGPTP